jgi:hypothetical protein
MMHTILQLSLDIVGSLGFSESQSLILLVNATTQAEVSFTGEPCNIQDTRILVQ